MADKSQIGRGLFYFFIGIAIGCVFYVLITGGWRGSVRESQWQVQARHAFAEKDWAALDELAQRLVRQNPRGTIGWQALVLASKAQREEEKAETFLGWAENAHPKEQEAWDLLRAWEPGGDVPAGWEEETLPTLGEPVVVARVAEFDTEGESGPRVTVEFDHAIFSFLAARSAVFVEEATGRETVARFPEPDATPEVEKTELEFVPYRPLPEGVPLRFVFDLPQERMGGAWLKHPVVKRFTLPEQTPPTE